MFHKKAKTFCLFCGSQFGDLTDLPEQIEAFAFGLSEKGYRVIFGGGQEGLMGRVYKGAARAKQHHITGVPFFSMLHELKDSAKAVDCQNARPPQRFICQICGRLCDFSGSRRNH